MIKGIVRLQFIDINTNEVTREITKENFIFFSDYKELWVSGSSLKRPCIMGRGMDVYPMFDKSKNYYESNVELLTGYAPDGTSTMTFNPKTENNPAHWDFYSLFLPPATLSSISCIALTTINQDNLKSSYQTSAGIYTALNLDPYCYQSPTEYLNIYYRLILLEDSENDSPEFVRNELVRDIARDSRKLIFPNTHHKTYPFRIEEKMDKGGLVNFLSSYRKSLVNTTTTYPSIEHEKLINAQKTYSKPDVPPNQYKQMNYGLINTVVRGTGECFILPNGDVDNSYGSMVAINPLKITPEISSNFTGIGNVFSARGDGVSTIFDAANFPTGSGRMKTSGVINNTSKDAFPTTIQCEVSKAADHMIGAEYRYHEYRFLGDHSLITRIPLVLFPSYTIASTMPYTEEDFKKLMYSSANSVHVNGNNLVKYKEDRSFISWDETGITIYDVYHGRLESFDVSTTPSLAVTNVVSVKVDSNDNIWIACSETGLWKIHINEMTETTVMTRIGVLPGSQQKCYAIDVDNHGNIFAIFWGTGLFYSSTGGSTWVNTSIDYDPFSGYDNSGFVSRWSYVARIKCNPYRNASNGVAQLLILMKESAPQFSNSAGCWYDYQSQLTTGITNSGFKTQTSWCRDRFSNENIVVSDLDDTWFFLSGGYVMYWTKFQNTTSMSGRSYTNNSFEPHSGVNVLNKEFFYDPVSGTIKEQILIGLMCSNDSSKVDVFDIETKSIVKRISVSSNAENLSVRPYNAPNGIKLGKNIFVAFLSGTNIGNMYTKAVSYILINQLGYNKSTRQWCAKNWGWNGSEWVLNHLGGKPVHTSSDSLSRGASVSFKDGLAVTKSWVKGDTFTFTVFDGYFKDNSSSMVLRDTVYYKPTEVVEVFEPNVVTLIDKGDDIGIVNKYPLELDWNINDLPDTTYSEEVLITNGDEFFNSVSLLCLFNAETGLIPTVGNYSSVFGIPIMDGDFQIFESESIHLNGSSGFIFDSSIMMTPTETFSIECTIALEVTNVNHTLFDFRSNSNHTFAVIINSDSKIVIEMSGGNYGNTGITILPGEIYNIKINRTNKDWVVFVNGVINFEFNAPATTSNPTGMHLFKRYQQNSNGWEGLRGWASNVRITRGYNRIDDEPLTFFQTFGNDYSGARLSLKGVFNNGSVISNRELVGDWEVIFRDITPDVKSYRRSRPKMSFGVSVLKYVESPTDITYRCCGDRFLYMMNNHGSSIPSIPSTVTEMMRVSKVGGFVKMEKSVNGGIWTIIGQPYKDLNPVHHICIWQVQADTVPMLTPSVEIVKNGFAYFSKAGLSASASGRHHKRFLAMDVFHESDVNISLNDEKVSKSRSNFVDYDMPLEGEVLALQAGTLVFHANDEGKAISGRMITIHD